MESSFFFANIFCCKYKDTEIEPHRYELACALQLEMQCSRLIAASAI